MLTRLFALLMLFALAMPAAAMPLCHQDEAQASASHGGHDKPAKDHADKGHAEKGEKHGCLACAAPLDRDSATPPGRHWTSAVPVAVLHASLHGLIPAPEPPPPRA